MKRAEKASESVLVLRVAVEEIEPEIWRTILVPDDYTLAYLHVVLQTVMDWLDYHLHEFEIDGRTYGRPDYDEDAPESLLDERTVTLKEVLTGRTKSFLYSYDFGDEWHVKLTVEDTVSREPQEYYPHCVEGARAAPPDDVGGVGGYEDFLEAIADPAHENHDELLDWIGGEFDPEEFDPEYINIELRKIFRLLD